MSVIKDDDWTPARIKNWHVTWIDVGGRAVVAQFGPLGASQPPPLKQCFRCGSLIHPSTVECQICRLSGPPNNAPPVNNPPQMGTHCTSCYQQRAPLNARGWCDDCAKLIHGTANGPPATPSPHTPGTLVTGPSGLTQAQIDKMIGELMSVPTPAAPPPPEKPAKPIHEMTLADYRKGVDSWWDKRRKS